MKVEWDSPDNVTRLIKTGQPGWAVVMMIVHYGAKLVLQLLGEGVIYAVLASVTLVAVTMMVALPPEQFANAATSFGFLIKAFAGAFESGFYQILGWLVALVVLIAASAVIVVQRQRRKQQDQELRQLREEKDPARASSQMTIDQLLARK